MGITIKSKHIVINLWGHSKKALSLKGSKGNVYSADMVSDMVLFWARDAIFSHHTHNGTIWG